MDKQGQAEKKTGRERAGFREVNMDDFDRRERQKETEMMRTEGGGDACRIS